MSDTTPKKRSTRQETEQRLVAAIGELLEHGSFDDLGVNVVARQAGVDKVLIYRYFGGLEGLLRAYGQSSQFWPTLDEVLEDGRVLEEPDPARRGRRILENYWRELSQRPVTLELLAMEMTARNALTRELERVREQWFEELLERLAAAEISHTEEIMRIFSLLAAGLNYLAVRARELRVFSGLDLSSEPEWQRTFDAVETMLRAMLED